MYGIDKISTRLRNVDLNKVSKLFHNEKREKLQRPVGEIDILLGFDYAGFHPNGKEST